MSRTTSFHGTRSLWSSRCNYSGLFLDDAHNGHSAVTNDAFESLNSFEIQLAPCWKEAYECDKHFCEFVCFCQLQNAYVCFTTRLDLDKSICTSL